ncbi:dTDP-3-amino-3,6-dideoxy-alpha-D-galactopyranose transaminase [anaerobic digester metagenome]
MIPIAKPCVGDEEAEAAASVIRSGMLASGKEVRMFEEEFASYIGVSEGIASSNGTTALHVALLAHNIGPGDEVIVPSFTFIATATSVSMTGATPVLADVDKKTYCIDPNSVVDILTPKTKAVIGVHLFGQACDVRAIHDICVDHKLEFIEDCAQAHGTEFNGKKVGSFGACGCFSFYPTKNMTSGEGGMITCQDASLSERIRRLINHGQKEKYLHTELGYNFRLTDIAAAIGRVQLKKLSGMNKKRQDNAAYYNSSIKNDGITLPFTDPKSNHVFHQYAICVDRTEMDRDSFAKVLHEKGIGTAVHYPIPIHKQPLYRNTSDSRCPVSESLSKEILSLPIYPDLQADERKFIVETINGVN